MFPLLFVLLIIMCDPRLRNRSHTKRWVPPEFQPIRYLVLGVFVIKTKNQETDAETKHSLILELDF
jgi:hypothetical protein